MSDSANPLEPVAGEPPKEPKGDLGVRTLSAIVMVAVAFGAFWARGDVFTVFVGIIGLGLIWEWWGLVSKIAESLVARLLWMIGGLVYVAWPMYILNNMWVGHAPNNFVRYLIIFALLLVIIVDVGAYAAGRTFGGKKIAPSISPSKTWAGLYGGMTGAVIFAMIYWAWSSQWTLPVSAILIAGFCAALMACIAQAGDFFESWMKRRAAVKDSGSVIPGHGGLLDRLDGHLAVISMLPVVLALAFSLMSAFDL